MKLYILENLLTMSRAFIIFLVCSIFSEIKFRKYLRHLRIKIATITFKQLRLAFWSQFVVYMWIWMGWHPNIWLCFSGRVQNLTNAYFFFSVSHHRWSCVSMVARWKGTFGGGPRNWATPIGTCFKLHWRLHLSVFYR